MHHRPPRSTRTDTLFPYTTLFRSSAAWGSAYVNQFIDRGRVKRVFVQGDAPSRMLPEDFGQWYVRNAQGEMVPRSEEHTSELQLLMRISYAAFRLTNKRHPPPLLPTRTTHILTHFTYTHRNS